MRVMIMALVASFLLLATSAYCAGSDVLRKNLVGWEGISLRCDMHQLPLDGKTDNAGYICGLFYSEFSTVAKQRGVPFAYVQTEGQYTADKLPKMGYLPLRVDMARTDNQGILVTLMADLADPNTPRGRVETYSRSTQLKGDPFSYGNAAIAFFRDSAAALVQELKSAR
jgi:hypothetical protein